MNEDRKIINFQQHVKLLLSTLGNYKPSDNQIRITETLLLRSTVNLQLAFHKKLTDREIFCLLLAAKGSTMIETAEILKVKFTTVQTWYKKIKKKLGCRSMTQALFEGIRFGYVQPKSIDKE